MLSVARLEGAELDPVIESMLLHRITQIVPVLGRQAVYMSPDDQDTIYRSHRMRALAADRAQDEITSWKPY